MESYIIDKIRRRDEEKKEERRPALRIPALDPSKLPFPDPTGNRKPPSDRGVHITPGYDDDEEEPVNRRVVITDNTGYNFN